MKILVDMDSILVDLLTPWLAGYNAAYEDDLCVERITSWDTHKFARAGTKIYEWLEQPGNIENCPALPGAIEGFRALMKLGHDVLICTATQQVHAYAEKAAWVKKHIPEFSLKNLIITFRKDWVKADALIDDGPHNIEDYREAWPEAQIATIAYPYNKAARLECDFVAHDYRDTAAAWSQLVGWAAEA